MPILNVKTSAARSEGMSQKIAALLLDHSHQILGKDRALTSIAIDYIDPTDWIIAGKSLAEWGQHSLFLDIRITDETNTKAEKARYIEAVFEGFEGLLGPLHEESYIHVHDVRASAYGYGGKTQEYRYQHA
jgi:4-oxalocrotonate tautomerase